MRKLRKSVDSPKVGFESAKNLPSTVRFLDSVFTFRFVRLLVAVVLLFGLMWLDAQAQNYQEYPISPTLSVIGADPVRSAEDQAIIDSYSQLIITHPDNVPKLQNRQLYCPFFLTGSKIISIKQIGSFARVVAQYRSYRQTAFFKVDVSFLRVGMIVEESLSEKRYREQIEANKQRIAARNQAVRDSLENRTWLSKIINPE